MFTLAIRNLLRHKAFSAITLLGLSMGLACCLLIGIYVHHELSYDRFHEKGERIVRVVTDYAYEGEKGTIALTGTAVLPVLQRAFPEIEAGVRIYSADMFGPVVVRKGETVFQEEEFLYADAAFTEIFSFKLIEGDPKTALLNPNSLILTQGMAKKYFGDEMPLGKTLNVSERDYQITGVVADVPANSQIQFDFVASFSTLRVSKTEEWGSANYVSYLLLRDKQDISSLQTRIPPFARQHSDLPMSEANYQDYRLEPLYEVHLHSQAKYGLATGGNITYIYLLSLVGFVILLIACTNYVNLTTARSAERAREVGIRKTIGAGRSRVFWQFMGESLLMALAALLLAVMLSAWLLPYASELAQKELSISLLAQPKALIALIGLGLLVGLLAGGYPAFVLSGYQPIQVLRGSFRSGTKGRMLRKGLIVSQFLVATFLIMCTLVIRRQMKFVQQTQLGYQAGQLLVLPADEQVLAKFSTLKTELLQHPGITGVTKATDTPVDIGGMYSYLPEGATEAQMQNITAIGVEKDFIRTLGIPVLAGADFTEADVQQISGPYDSLHTYHFAINEAALAQTGLDPEAVIGKKWNLNGRSGEVKAVLKNFHFSSLHKPIGPLCVFLDPGYHSDILIRLSGSDVPAALGHLSATWKTLAPHRPFTYEFLDEEFARMYRAETRTTLIFQTVSVLAIALACLGLLGLSAFAVE
ncbi:MAG: ABC transporter permease, partial [Bacteroidetes bacterium]